MTDDARVLAKATGLGDLLDLVQTSYRSQRRPGGSPAPSVQQTITNVTQASSPVLSRAETARRASIQQAESGSQASVGGYKWATLKSTSQIGGRTFQAGTRIAVAPSQTTLLSIGKAHTTSIVTKVWAKFGQTFDSSSWIEGWLPENSFTYTGQAATWSSSTGFGSVYSSSMNDRDVLAKSLGLGPDLSPMSARGYRPPPPVPRAVQSPLEYASTPTRGGGYRPPLPTPTVVQSPAELNQSPDLPTPSALTLPTQSMPPTQGAPKVSIKAPKKLHNIPLYRVSAIHAPMRSCAAFKVYDGDTWWFEDPPSVQWTIKTYYGVFLFGSCDIASPSGGGPHGFKKGTELWVSNQTMTTTWYHYPVKNQFNTVSFYRVYRVGGQPVLGWVMQQTVGSLAGLFPSGTAGLPAGVGAVASSDHERVLHRELAR